MTVFSNMSDPDIMLTIRAYTLLKMSLENGIQRIPNGNEEGIDDLIDKITEENKQQLAEINRLDELTNSLINEWQKRGNS